MGQLQTVLQGLRIPSYTQHHSVVRHASLDRDFLPSHNVTNIGRRESGGGRRGECEGCHLRETTLLSAFSDGTPSQGDEHGDLTLLKIHEAIVDTHVVAEGHLGDLQRGKTRLLDNGTRLGGGG